MGKMANVYQFKYEDLKGEDKGIIFGEVNQDRINRLYKKEFSYSLDGMCFQHLDEQSICEKVYMNFNSNDRPNGKVNRSISVGDLIELEGNIYVCASIGFDKVDLNLSKVQKSNNYKIY